MIDTLTPPRIHVLAKPTGAICNLNCSYCFFLHKDSLYPGSHFRMSDEVLETYIRQLIEYHRTPQVTVAWQGGEPTLMGLDFYRRAIEYQKQYKKPAMVFENTMQTNGTLLNDEWCEFFKENNFLIGLSLDGPGHLHDVYRRDKQGRPTFDRVMRGLRLLQKHGVDYNILTTVNRVNADHPLEVYRFLRDEVGTTWIQFIPAIERLHQGKVTILPAGRHRLGALGAAPAVRPTSSLLFLMNGYGTMSARSLSRPSKPRCATGWACPPPACASSTPPAATAWPWSITATCMPATISSSPIISWATSCTAHLLDLVGAEKQHRFGQDKQDTLPQSCRECEVRFACQGECPKNRFRTTPAGESGLNYLCAPVIRPFFSTSTGL